MCSAGILSGVVVSFDEGCLASFVDLGFSAGVLDAETGAAAVAAFCFFSGISALRTCRLLFCPPCLPWEKGANKTSLPPISITLSLVSKTRLIERE